MVAVSHADLQDVVALRSQWQKAERVRLEQDPDALDRIHSTGPLAKTIELAEAQGGSIALRGLASSLDRPAE